MEIIGARGDQKPDIVFEICKAASRALFVELHGYHVTDDGKLYKVSLDSYAAETVEQRFSDSMFLGWLKENVRGAVFLSIVKTSWGSDHAEYYVFEYKDGSFRYKLCRAGRT